VALDVADDGADTAVGQVDHVVPVAAELDAAAGRHVARGGDHAGMLGQHPRQQGLLEPLREGVLGIVDAGALEGLAEQGGQGDQDRVFGQDARVLG